MGGVAFHAEAEFADALFAGVAVVAKALVSAGFAAAFQNDAAFAGGADAMLAVGRFALALAVTAVLITGFFESADVVAVDGFLDVVIAASAAVTALGVLAGSAIAAGIARQAFVDIDAAFSDGCWFISADAVALVAAFGVFAFAVCAAELGLFFAFVDVDAALTLFFFKTVVAPTVVTAFGVLAFAVCAADVGLFFAFVYVDADGLTVCIGGFVVTFLADAPIAAIGVLTITAFAAGGA